MQTIVSCAVDRVLYSDNCAADRVRDADNCRVLDVDNGRQVGLVAGQLELPGGRELP